MKKTLLILLTLLLAASMFADFTWMQLNLYEGIGVSQPFAGETYNLTYFELEGGGRTGILNLYYFVDVNHIFGVRDELNEGNSPGNYFMKINPRFSITKLMGKESCVGPIKESYLAIQYKGWNGGDNYYVGLGTDLAIPLFDSFSFNFYKMFQHIEEAQMKNDPTGVPYIDGYESKFEDAGWVIAINWFTNLKKFSEDFNLTFQGWSDFGLANTWAEDGGGVATEWQMFNGFFWNYQKWSLSTSVKIHNNFLYFDGETHDAISPWVGLHRRF